MANTSLLIEGWRFVPHSYALLNQWQILELLKRPDIALYMRDLPYHQPRWKPSLGLMRPEQEAMIAQIREPEPFAPPDATLRISVPVRFGPVSHGRTYVLGTADFGCLPSSMIENGRSLREAHQGTDVVIISPSEWSKWGLLRGGADPDRVAVVPLGADPEVFRPASHEERLQLRQARGWQDKFVFLNVSAMTRSKGTDIILKAFARVAQRFDHVLLCLKGTEQVYPSGQWLRKWWSGDLTADERRACGGRIRYVGNSLSTDGLADIYRAADSYLTPYRTEAFNMPALEAIASGLPIICTAGGPTDEFTTADFARRVKAKLVSDRIEAEQVRLMPDLDDVTEAMIEVVERAEIRERALRAGPDFVRSQFTWRHTVDKLLSVLGR